MFSQHTQLKDRSVLSNGYYFIKYNKLIFADRLPTNPEEQFVLAQNLLNGDYLNNFESVVQTHIFKSQAEVALVNWTCAVNILAGLKSFDSENVSILLKNSQSILIHQTAFISKHLAKLTRCKINIELGRTNDEKLTAEEIQHATNLSQVHLEKCNMLLKHITLIRHQKIAPALSFDPQPSTLLSKKFPSISEHKKQTSGPEHKAPKASQSF